MVQHSPSKPTKASQTPPNANIPIRPDHRFFKHKLHIRIHTNTPVQAYEKRPLLYKKGIGKNNPGYFKTKIQSEMK
jgi:hypothetical protein